MGQARTPHFSKAGQRKICNGHSSGELIYKQCKSRLVTGGIVLVNQSARSCLINYADYMIVFIGCFFFIRFGTKISDRGPILRTESPISVMLFFRCSDPLNAGFMMRHYLILSNCRVRFYLTSKYNRQICFVN